MELAADGPRTAPEEFLGTTFIIVEDGTDVVVVVTRWIQWRKRQANGCRP